MNLTFSYRYSRSYYAFSASIKTFLTRDYWRQFFAMATVILFSGGLVFIVKSDASDNLDFNFMMVCSLFCNGVFIALLVPFFQRFVINFHRAGSGCGESKEKILNYDCEITEDCFSLRSWGGEYEFRVRGNINIVETLGEWCVCKEGCAVYSLCKKHLDKEINMKIKDFLKEGERAAKGS